MSPRRLHVLVVDAAVGIDVVAEVDVIGNLTQVSLDVTDIAIANSTVPVHVSDQEAYACLGGGQGVALVVMHIGESEGHVLRVAGLTIERHQERVRIIWIDAQAAACAAAGGCAVFSIYVVVEREANFQAFVIAAIFHARKRDIEGSVFARLP